MTALAAFARQTSAQTGLTGTSEGAPGVAPEGNAVGTGAQLPQPEPVPPRRSPAHYLWAILIARTYEVFPLVCPLCGGPMRLIAFITQGAQVSKIWDYIGVDPQPAHIAPARRPPLWNDCDAQVGVGVQIEPDWDLAAQPAPDCEVNQRITW